MTVPLNSALVDRSVEYSGEPDSAAADRCPVSVDFISG